MKKKLLKVFIFMLLVLPCSFVFGACKNDEPPVAKVSSISIELLGDGVDYVADTNTLRFEYGTKIEFEKEDLKVTAKFDDNSTKEVSDYVVDLSSVKNTPNVGTYEITVKYAEKTASINIEVYPKKIAKPTMEDDQMIVFQEDTIGDIKLEQSPETTFDENTMTLVEGSVYSATDAGSYQFRIIPDSNHVWEDFETDEREEVVFEWVIDKATMYTSDPTSLYFEYEEGVERTISFDLSREQFIPFNEFFEVSGTLSATEVGEYSFVIKLKADKKINYEFFEIYREEGVDFEYNADRTEITYFWKIVEAEA